jgi:hypothetical protein
MIPCPYILYTHSHSPKVGDLYRYPTFRTRGCDTCHLYLKVSKGKRRITETQIFHHAKIKSSKKSSKRNQNPSRYYYNSIITNLKPKLSCSKNPHIKLKN